MRSRWPARTRSGSSTWTPARSASGPGPACENIVDGPLADGRVRPAERPGDRRQAPLRGRLRGLGRPRRSASASDASTACSTIVGEGLFEFGDVDGRGPRSGSSTAWAWPTATASSTSPTPTTTRSRSATRKTRSVKTLAGDGEAGTSDEPAQFYEPGGLSLAGTTLYVADTNNHVVRDALDLETGKVKTLTSADVTPPARAQVARRFPNADDDEAPRGRRSRPATIVDARGDARIPERLQAQRRGPDARPGRDARQGPDPRVEGPATTGAKIDPPVEASPSRSRWRRPARPGDSLDLKVSVSAFDLQRRVRGLCTIKSYVWNVPVTFADDGEKQSRLGGRRQPSQWRSSTPAGSDAPIRSFGPYRVSTRRSPASRTERRSDCAGRSAVARSLGRQPRCSSRRRAAARPAGIAEGLPLLGGLAARCTRGRAGRRPRRPEGVRRASDPVAEVVVEVAGPVARDPGELDEGEDRVGRLAPGAYARSSRAPDPARPPSRGGRVFAGPYSGTRAPSRPRHQRT